MSYTAKRLIAIAQAEIGYKEKASNASLDNNTANAGSNNYTKYARDLAAAGYYNGNKNGFAWCDVFVDWCFFQLADKNRAKAENIECQTGELGAGCIYSKGYYKAQGRIYSTPEPGDQVFFKQDGDIVHTGIVETVSSSQITTIEGNSSNQVARRTYSRSDGYIDSYGRPKYDVENTSTPAPNNTVEKTDVKIIESILTKNPCYTAGKTITVQGLMLHSVGCPQPSASVFVKNWNSESYDSACVHGFIDGNTGDVYQTLPWNRRGWHAGGSANNTHIGVEMCEPACIKYTSGANFTCSDTATAKAVVKRTYESAVKLFAYLCKKYNLDPLKNGVIISHNEGRLSGVASSHVDPEHLWDGLKTGYTMDGFRKAVAAAMGTVSTTSPVETKSDLKVGDVVTFNGTTHYTSANSSKGVACKPGKAEITKVYKGKHPYHLVAVKGSTSNVYGWVDEKDVYEANPTGTAPVTAATNFIVKVTADALNIRKGAGTNYSVTGVIRDGGCYTIVQTSGNWGKLKSGAGWICLDYTQTL